VSEIDKDSDEFKQAVAEAVAEQVEGLKTKNAELIAKNKKLQAGATVDPAELAAVEAERDQLKADLAAANKAAKKTAADLDAATKRANDSEAAHASTLKDAALADALSKAGVTPALLKAAKALHGGALQVADDNGVRTIKAGEVDLDKYITDWAASEEGKHFIAAPDASGGGSQGGRGTDPNQRQGNAAGTRSEAIARAEQLLKQHAHEE